MQDLNFEFTTTSKFSREMVEKVLGTLSISATDDTINTLRYGGKSDVLENIVLDDKSLKDARIQLIPDRSGNPNIKFDFRNPELELPLKVLKHKLTQQDKQALAEGKFIEIKHKSDSKSLAYEAKEQLFLVGFNKEANKFTIGFKDDVLSQHGLKEGFTYGGYKFSEKERLALLNGENVAPKVFFDDETNRYVLANLSFETSGDKVYFHLSNAKLITDHDKALSLMMIHNKQDIIVDRQNSLPHVEKVAIESSKIPLPQDAQTNYKLHNRLLEEVTEAARTLNYNKLKELSQVNPTSINSVTVQSIVTSPHVVGLSNAEKLAVLHSLNIQQPEKIIDKGLFTVQQQEKVKAKSKSMGKAKSAAIALGSRKKTNLGM